MLLTVVMTADWQKHDVFLSIFFLDFLIIKWLSEYLSRQQCLSVPSISSPSVLSIFQIWLQIKALVCLPRRLKIFLRRMPPWLGTSSTTASCRRGGPPRWRSRACTRTRSSTRRRGCTRTLRPRWPWCSRSRAPRRRRRRAPWPSWSRSPSATNPPPSPASTATRWSPRASPTPLPGTHISLPDLSVSSPCKCYIYLIVFQSINDLI